MDNMAINTFKFNMCYCYFFNIFFLIKMNVYLVYIRVKKYIVIIIIGGENIMSKAIHGKKYILIDSHIIKY